jgi:hypothetical protein
MPKNEPRICGLVRWHARKSDACARAITISLSPELVRRFGRVQGVFMAPMSPKQADLVVAHLEDAFTRGALEAERRRGPSTPQETLFEDAIAVTNQAVTRLFGESGVNLDPRQATGAIMAVRGGDIIVAVWGQPELLLYRFDTEGRAKIFDLLSDEADSPRGRTGFTNVISGELNLGDRMICATRSIKDIIGPDKMDHALRLDPGGAVEQLRDDLAAANDAAAVAVLVTDVAETRYVEELPVRETGAHSSTRELEQTATVTQEILSPSLMSTMAGAARNVAATVVGSAASAAAGLAAAAAENMKQRREGAARQSEERARVAAEEAKKPKWLRPGDKVVGESQVDVIGETFCYPLVDLEHSEHDIVALAEAERLKTKVSWRGKEEAAETPDAEAMTAPIEEFSEATAAITPEMLKEAIAQGPAATAEPAPDLSPVLPPDAPIPAAAPSPIDWQGLIKAISTKAVTKAVAIKNKVMGAGKKLATPEGRQIVPLQMKDSTAAIVNGLRRQTLTRKLAAGAVVLVVALTSVMVVVNREMKINEAERQTKARLLETFTQKLDSAEASLIYKDTKRASELFDEAATALDQYQPADDQEKQLRAQYVAKLEQKRAAFRHEIALGEPKSVISVSGAGGAAVSLVHYAVTDGTQWFVAADGQVFRQKTNEPSPAAVAKLAGTPKATVVLGGKVLIVGEKGQTLAVAGDGKTTAGTASVSDLAVTDAVTYAGNLYVLDAAHNRIVKLTPAGAGWGNAQPYVKDGTDVAKAVALAIDSNVYALNADATLAKLYKGLKTTYALGGFNPVAATATRLQLPDAGDRLYVLDPGGARLLAFAKKDGAFVAQYKADALKDATDFQEDAKAKLLTVIVGNKAMKYDLPQ